MPLLLLNNKLRFRFRERFATPRLRLCATNGGIIKIGVSEIVQRGKGWGVCQYFVQWVDRTTTATFRNALQPPPWTTTTVTQRPSVSDRPNMNTVLTTHFFFNDEQQVRTVYSINVILFYVFCVLAVLMYVLTYLVLPRQNERPWLRKALVFVIQVNYVKITSSGNNEWMTKFGYCILKPTIKYAIIC